MQVPRKPTGAASMHRVEQQEEIDAKALKQRVCTEAFSKCESRWHADVQRVLDKDVVGLWDLPWIADVMDLCIRCTCCKEVGVLKCSKCKYQTRQDIKTVLLNIFKCSLNQLLSQAEGLRNT